MIMAQYRSFRSDTSHGSGPVFEVRRALGISQAHMAELMGYKSYSSVARFERSNQLPRAKKKRQRLFRIVANKCPEESLPYVMALAKGQMRLPF